jgi:uncharacterized protein YbjQ (UPF0145 family)
MEKEMITTAFALDGFRIVKNLGMVRGVTVRSMSVGKTFRSSFQIMAGGKLALFSDLCEKARAEAFDIMVKHAEELGANAVIGVRYDATAMGDIASEVLCYGTAVLADRMK